MHLACQQQIHVTPDAGSSLLTLRLRKEARVGGGGGGGGGGAWSTLLSVCTRSRTSYLSCAHVVVHSRL